MIALEFILSFLLVFTTASAFQAATTTIGNRNDKICYGSASLSLAAARSAFMMPDEPNEEPKPSPPAPRRQPPLPTVAGESGQLDVVSRLLKDRILLLGTDVNDEVSNVLVAQLLYLANEDPDSDITLYINSPGGSVSAGLAIYDTMQYVLPPISTWCVGQACSMGSLLLAAGTQGNKTSLI